MNFALAVRRSLFKRGGGGRPAEDSLRGDFDGSANSDAASFFRLPWSVDHWGSARAFSFSIFEQSWGSRVVSTWGQSSSNQLCARPQGLIADSRAERWRRCSDVNVNARLLHWRCWDNQSSSLCDSDPEFGGSWPRGWAVGRDHLGPNLGRSLLSSPSQHTAQSPFRSRVAMGGGSLRQRFFGSFLCVRSTDLEQGRDVEGCSCWGVGLI